jgi:hypothetical protein
MFLFIFISTAYIIKFSIYLFSMFLSFGAIFVLFIRIIA